MKIFLLLLTIPFLAQRVYSQDGPDIIWDKRTHHSETIVDICFFPDSKTAATANEDGYVWIWDVETGEVLNKILVYDTDESENIDVRQIDISSDGKMLATSGWHTNVKIFNTSDWSLIHEIPYDFKFIFGLEFSPDSKYLAIGADIDGFEIYNTETWGLWKRIKDFPYKIDPKTGHGYPDANYLCYFSDGAKIALTGDFTMIYDLTTDEILQLYDVHSVPKVSPDGRYLSVYKSHNAFHIYDVILDSLIYNLDLPATNVRSTYTSDSKYLIINGIETKVKVIDLASGEIIYEYLSDYDKPKFISSGPTEISPDDKYIFTSTGDGVWGLKTDSWLATGIEEGGENVEKIYPNPSSGLIGINFEISQPSFVNIVLYDLSGNQADIIFQDNLPAGAQNISYNTKNLMPGTYFINIQSEKFQKTLKLIKE